MARRLHVAGVYLRLLSLYLFFLLICSCKVTVDAGFQTPAPSPSMPSGLRVLRTGSLAFTSSPHRRTSLASQTRLSAGHSPFESVHKRRDPNNSLFVDGFDKSSPISSLKQYIARWFSNRWFRIKKNLRYLVQKCTVYVLECENGKFYVGSTRNRRQRLRQHFDQPGSGSVWTRTNTPLRVLKTYKRVPFKYLLGMESQVTAELMLQKGVNNVRGSMFSQPRRYTIGDIEQLVGFLGHYNDLNYKDIRESLEKTLPASPTSQQRTPVRLLSASESRRMRKKLSVSGKKCFKCGKYGHLAADCPAEDGACFICGEVGHFARDCPNREDAKTTTGENDN